MKQFVHWLSGGLTNHFLLVWSLMQAAIAVGCLLVWRFGASRGGTTVAPPGRSASSSRLPVLLVLLLLVAGYSFSIQYKEDFAFDDDDMFTEYSLQGRDVAPAIWPELGRFFPLEIQEFNYVGRITQSALGYHLVAIVQVAIAAVVLFRLRDELPPWVRAAGIALAFATPNVAVSFFGLIFPERNIIFWLTIFVAATRRFGETRSVSSAWLSLAAMQCALYYKEPVFVIFAGFIVVSVLARTLGAPRWRERLRPRTFIQTEWLAIAQLALVAGFVALYVIVVLPQTSFGYASARRVGTITAAVGYLRLDPWLSVLVVSLIARVVLLIRDRSLPHGLWDPLALGAALYALAYCTLGMFNEYYMAPVDFVAVLYASHLIARLGRQPVSAWKRVAVTVFALFLVLASVAHSFGHIFERKGWIQGKVGLMTFLNDEARTSARQNRGLFFPKAEGYRLMLVSSFLEYKGLRLSTKNVSPVDYTIKSPRRFRDDRCVDYRPHYPCRQAPAPEAGDLIVVLPDEQIQTPELDELNRHATLVYHYSPAYGRLATWAMRTVGHRVQDNWLDVYVFRREQERRP